MGCCQRYPKTLAFILFVIGGALVAGGCVVKWQLFPGILQDQVEKNLQLKDGTEAWDNFLEPPVPIYMNFYMMNVENALAVAVNGSKPMLKEVGPYVYREIRKKENVTFGGEDQIYYNEYRAYIYDQDQTEKAGCKPASVNGNGKCSPDDKASVLNPIMTLLAFGLHELPKIWPKIEPIIEPLVPEKFKSFLPQVPSLAPIVVNYFCDPVLKDIDDGLIYTKPVNDILFNGAKTKVLDQVFNLINNTIQPLIDENKNISINIIDEIDKRFPQLAGGTFGIFKGRNDTVANMFFRVDSGANNLADYLSISQFNGQNQLPKNWWAEVGRTPSQTKAGVKGDCHDIKGTDGTMFAPGMAKDQTLWVFVSELCRSIWLNYDSDQNVKGIAVRRYRAKINVFDMDNQDNFCYCPKFLSCAKANTTSDTYDNSACKEVGCMDGLINVGNCLGGAPIYMSSPHFYHADPSLVAAFGGLNPDPEKHDTILDLEPITGLAINARKRIQVNFPIYTSGPAQYFHIIKNLKQAYHAWPVFWADENAMIDEVNANKFKSEVQKPMAIVNGVSLGAGVALGGILVLISLGILLFAKPRTTV